MSPFKPDTGGAKGPTIHATTGRRSRFESGRGRTIRFLLTLAVAASADVLQWLFPPLWIPIDVVTALVFVALWGLRWEIAVALVPELAPGVDTFPCWIALAIYLGSRTPAQQPTST
jgi:hypothetical protein